MGALKDKIFVHITLPFSRKISALSLHAYAYNHIHLYIYIHVNMITQLPIKKKSIFYVEIQIQVFLIEF